MSLAIATKPLCYPIKRCLGTLGAFYGTRLFHGLTSCDGLRSFDASVRACLVSISCTLHYNTGLVGLDLCNGFPLSSPVVFPMCYSTLPPLVRFYNVLLLASLVCSVMTSTAFADGPDDNFPSKVRLVPPKGIAVPAEKVEQWQQTSAQLLNELNSLAHVPDTDRWQVEGLLRAIRMTHEEEMFYNETEISFADSLVSLAKQRLAAIKEGKRGFELLTWNAPLKNGSRLLIGAFRSNIDQSLQPFGLVVPENWLPDTNKPTRLDVWLHGRDERSGEVGFLQRRFSQAGEFAPANTIVLHPYGRYSNAFKFAGEIDVLEGIEFVSNSFPVDPNRISIRGFSMGGAGCWQMAVHYPGKWFAATPGAGFSETTEFLRIFQKEEFRPTTFQKKLLHWYDCPDWSSNLRYLPTVAYSGELDRQKQAADIMEASLRSKAIELPHIIGPQTDHKFHPDSKLEISRRLDKLAIQGRDEYPAQIDFTTFTLRYPTHTWLTIDRLSKHWEEARIQASRTKTEILIETQNIERFLVTLPVALFDLPNDQSLTVVIDEVKLELSPRTLITDRSANPKWRLVFEKQHGKWETSRRSDDQELAKRPGLQGPVDDAFLSKFVFVPPPTVANKADTATEKWIQAEYAHATSQWKRHFRGDINTASAERFIDMLDNAKLPGEAEANLQAQNLDCHWILFGTPESNPVIARLAMRLPIEWSKEQIRVGQQRFANDRHALILIYPNPYLPNRYIVFNSGFTFREYAYLNNARQIPMLPDWAIVDTASQDDGQWPTSQWPGRIVEADFFDEAWQLTSP